MLITQVSSVTFVGLALGKEVHSGLDLPQLRRLLPLQNACVQRVRAAKHAQRVVVATTTDADDETIVRLCARPGPVSSRSTQDCLDCHLQVGHRDARERVRQDPLEPQELRELVASIREVESALGDGVKRRYPNELPRCEATPRAGLSPRFQLTACAGAAGGVAAAGGASSAACGGGGAERFSS